MTAPDRTPAAQRLPTKPRFSVVIPTHNRADALSRAVSDVLGQDFEDLEAIVVVDGSSDDTRARLATVADPRLRVVVRSNEGVCRARNAGAAAARGTWLVFLDDDDRADRNWLGIFDEHARDPEVGIVCCGGAFVDEDGHVTGIERPKKLGTLYGDITAQFLAGAFAVRRSIFDDSGGYDPFMTYGENFELGIRLGRACRSAGLRVATDDREPVRWVRGSRRPSDASQVRDLYGAATRLLEKYPDEFAMDRAARADTRSIAGINAARLGLQREARRHLLNAAWSRPWSPKGWMRFAVAMAPRASRRIWGDYSPRNVEASGPV